MADNRDQDQNRHVFSCLNHIISPQLMTYASCSIAILYICTGPYDIFWKDFYNTAEKHFLRNIKKEYYVFTDSETISPGERIHIIYQKQMTWPFPTLYRFKLFNMIKNKLENFDFIFFFNSNMLFINDVGEEILPSNTEKLVAVLHPGFHDKNNNDFTYERNPSSHAYIPYGVGEHYYMGGLNGGLAIDYLEMIDRLEKNTDNDLFNGIIALWHDESHLNCYLVGKPIKILDPSYGYPEGSGLPCKPKIIIRDKTKWGGHDYLRGKDIYPIKNKVLGSVEKYIRAIFHK